MTDFSAPLPPPPPPTAPVGAPVGAPQHSPFGVTQKPPRPAVTIGAALLAIGGALMILGSLLNWFEIAGEQFNGFSEGGENADGTKDGPFFAVFGGLLVVFGLVQLATRKVLALGIAGIVVSALGGLAALADLSDVNDAIDIGRLFGLDVSVGPGLYVVLVGAALSIAGSIAIVAKRRVWPPQS